ATASGFSEMKESGPRSMRNPSRCSVLMVPPTRGLASSNTIWTGCGVLWLSSTRRFAAAKPEIPPPTMTIRFKIYTVNNFSLFPGDYVAGLQLDNSRENNHHVWRHASLDNVAALD